MILYLFFLTTISVSSVSFLFFLINEIKNYINKNNHINNQNNSEQNSNNQIITANIPEKYEDKYLTQLRNINNSNSNSNSKLENEQTKSSTENYKNYKNNIIIEKTPIGNVAMFYDSVSETFTYYSDNTIPYRFLEVVARKYVLLYNCIELYIDMEYELEKKKLLDKQIKDKKLQETEFNHSHNQNQNNNCDSDKREKKSVFAKFKSYNKEAGSGRVNNAPPPKNSIPSSNNCKSNTEPCILKEEANRYLCKGRFSNFNLLQKVDRKKIDKKYALNFADFKKMTDSNN